MKEETKDQVVVLVSGLPGSGKSYFALRLSEEIGAEYISSDRIRMRMVRSPQYTESEKHLVYGNMLEEMEKALYEGRKVVLDATFIRKQVRDMFIEKAHELGLQSKIIRLTADEDLIKRRLSTKRPHSDADFEVYLKLREGFEEIRQSHLTLNSGSTGIDEMKKKALDFISGTA